MQAEAKQGPNEGRSAGAALPPIATERLIAAAIDGFVTLSVTFLIPYLGGLLAASYMLVRDGLPLGFMPNQSLGKKLLGIRAVKADGQPVDLGTSVQRNVPLAVAYLASAVAIVPLVGQMMAVLLVVLGMVLGVAEIVLVLTDPHGRRLGDRFAGTQVVGQDD